MSTKNDAAWESLFETHRILEKVERSGAYQISATEINKLREARLMTKFDHWIQLPGIFKQNNLTIQPNSRGTYLIGRFASYRDLPQDEDDNIEIVPFPAVEIATIDPTNIYSEAAALLCAYNAGIIEQLFNGEVSRLTVQGRMSTGRFHYLINDSQRPVQHRINVENSQCEIDSGFEGRDFFAIVEAKNVSVDDFLIRQLYYPYRLWAKKISKEVIPVFLTYSNDIFTFSVFRFTDQTQYNSIEMVERKRFQIGSNEIELPDIMALLERTSTVPEPERIPFPQADSFARVVDLLTQIYAASGPLSQEDVTTYYTFELRQTQYYTNAARYLGLVERHQDRERVTYSLTPRGQNIMERRPQARNIALVECILEHPVFNQTLGLWLRQGVRPTHEQVVEIMKAVRLGLDQEGNTTMRRRAQTVLSWGDWIIRLTRR
jgi:predicted transcriptional regulator